jgi:signal transduction histidine kinase
MRPLALGTGLCVALSAPLADFLLEHHDLARRAQAQASQVAARVSATVSAGATLTSSSSLAAVGAQRMPPNEAADDIVRVRISASTGELLADSQTRRPAVSWPLVTDGAPLVIAGRRAGRVEVTLAEAEWLERDLLLLGVFSVLGTVLGLALYYFPLRLFRGEDVVRLFAWRSIRAVDEERLRLSRDLHDGVGQSLGAAAVAVARLVGRSGASPEATEAARLIDGSLDELRRVARGLRPPTLDDLGLGAALEGLARDAAKTGLRVRIDIAELPRIDPDVEQTCFRLAQEALANVVRHAKATGVRVLLALEVDSVVLEVQDDGQGFAPRDELGLGLVGARERAARLAGSLRIESSAGHGTLIRAVLPLRAAA